MKRLLIATAVLASSLAVAAPAGAQTRSCRAPFNVAASRIQAKGTSCQMAQWLVVDEWNGPMTHWGYPGWRNYDWSSRWHVIWRYEDSLMPPNTWFRATQGRAIVTWEQGT
jgi:hypothetical protein